MDYRFSGRKRKALLDEKITAAMGERYAGAIKKIEIPQQTLGKVERRRRVAEQLKKLGVENEYVAYAIAARIIKK